MNVRAALVRTLIVIGLLNLLLSFSNAWPTLWPMPDARLSAELAAILLGLALLSRRGPLPSPALGVAALAVCLGSLLHYLNVTVPALLGRRLDLYWDGRHVWEVLKMGAEPPSLIKLAGIVVIVTLGTTVLYRLSRRCFAVLADSLQHPGLRAVVLLLSVGVLASWLLAPRLAPTLQGRFAPTVSGMVAEQAGLLHRALLTADDETLLGTSPNFAHTLDALEGADVIVIFAEAYGAITLDNAGFAAALGAARTTLGDAITDSGRRVVSARVTSPTFGGGSWLAHAELLSGLDMRDPNNYRLLLTTQRPTLVSHFGGQGYRTLGWMPGLQRPWPEGHFYGFERIGDANSIGYRGPAFGYWRTPDQAAMALLQVQELDIDRGNDPRPRLVVFPTVSTHAPFRPLAPYLADWSSVIATDAYATPDAVAAREAPTSWDDPVPAYLAALRYQFDWLAGWLAGLAPEKALIIVIGDHQPIGTVTGPGADWDVPVHVITRNERVLAHLSAQGFQPGLLPDKPALGAMRTLTPLLLEAFARN